MLWLPKTQEVTDNIAETITKVVLDLGYEYVQVSFKIVPGKMFYENGQHY
jgi:ribosome maturation factor RimP